jgi:hypothetical protein
MIRNDQKADQFRLEQNRWFNVSKNRRLARAIAQAMHDDMISLLECDYTVDYKDKKGCPQIYIKWNTSEGSHHAHLYVPRSLKKRIGGHMWTDGVSGISIETNPELIIGLLDLPYTREELVRFILDRC